MHGGEAENVESGIFVRWGNSAAAIMAWQMIAPQQVLCFRSADVPRGFWNMQGGGEDGTGCRKRGLWRARDIGIGGLFWQWTAAGVRRGQRSWGTFPRGAGNYHYAIGICRSTVLAVLYI
jgi:hypothetical protein